MMRLVISVLISLITINYLLAKNNELQSGTLDGNIVNRVSKEPIIGANVLLLGTTIGAASDINGRYLIENIPVGTYQLKVSAIGFDSQIKTDIIINSVRPAAIDFELSEKIIELESVVVVSDLFQKEPTEVNSISSFGYEELRRAPGGFEDVVRALSVLPGIAVADPGRNDLIVRGGAPSENLYLVDGIVVQNINHFGSQGSTGGPLSFINLDFVKDVSFSTGGFSALYGDKVSSVLRLDLREGRRDRFGGKGTISATQFGLNIEGPVSSNSNLIFSVRRSYLDFIFKAAGFGFVPEYYDALSKFNYKIDNHNSFSFLFISAFDRVKFFNDTPDKRLSNSRALGSNQNQYITGLTFKNIFSRGFYTLSLSRNFIDFDTSQSDSLLNPIFLNKSREGENALKSDVVLRLSPVSELNFGGQVKQIKFKSEVRLPPFQSTFGEALEIKSLNAKKEIYKANFYLQYSSMLMNRMRVNFGIRTDYFNAIQKKFSISPRFSLSYILTPVTNLNLSTGIYRQSPSYIWLAADESNKNLKQIRVTQLIAGIDHQLRDDIILKIEGYRKDYQSYPASTIRKYLVLANTGAGFAGAEDNFASFGLEKLVSEGKGFSRGIELSVQKKSSSVAHYGIFSLTYSESYFTALDNIKRIGSYDQKWIMNLTAGYIFNEKWEASIKFRYATGKPFSPFNHDGTQNIAYYNSERLPDTHSLDIRIDRRWNFNNWSLITYLDIQNIYNRKNVSSNRWNSRTMSIDNESAIGILPSIGVSVEF